MLNWLCAVITRSIAQEYGPFIARVFAGQFPRASLGVAFRSIFMFARGIVEGGRASGDGGPLVDDGELLGRR